MTLTLILNSTSVMRDVDGVVIPGDAANTDWQTDQAWLAIGNTANRFRS